MPVCRAKLQAVDPGPGAEPAPVLRAPRRPRARSPRAVPPPAAPLAAGGGPGRCAHPCAALPAGTGGAGDGPVRRPWRHHAGFLCASSAATGTAGQGRAGPASSRGQIRCWRSWPTPFRRAGLHVRRHVEIPGVGEVDFLIEECLVVETDGETHLEPRQVKKDRGRNNATALAVTSGCGTATTMSSTTRADGGSKSWRCWSSGAVGAFRPLNHVNRRGCASGAALRPRTCGPGPGTACRRQSRPRTGPPKVGRIRAEEAAPAPRAAASPRPRPRR